MPTAKFAQPVTPHATNPISPPPDALYCGGAGDVTCRPKGASADVLFAVPAGGYILCQVTHVRIAGTSATGIVGLNY